jgi:hypothetical protein
MSLYFDLRYFYSKWAIYKLWVNFNVSVIFVSVIYFTSCYKNMDNLWISYRLSINRPTIRKRLTTIYWRVNKYLKESNIVTRLAKERAAFLKINDINGISFFGTPDCQHCCSIAQAGMLILWDKLIRSTVIFTVCLYIWFEK